MRFSLQDVKKQVRRRDGELTVALHFLGARELRSEIAQLVGYYEERLGQARRTFNQDDASTAIGDYRLAHCLHATLSSWYVWSQPTWHETLEAPGLKDNKTLYEAGIDSAMALRLALFDYVNSNYGGFLDGQARTGALGNFADRYALTIPQLEYLLALDAEDEAHLKREGSVPDADAVAARYNQWVFEAALFNASEVHFVIDCAAFLQVQSSTSSTPLTGIGAVVKRLGFLARKLGVYYDLSYESSPAGSAPLLNLTLYGPQDMSGSPQQYGQRLSRLCRVLLGYGSRSISAHKRQISTALTRAIRLAQASVHMFQNVYLFSMDTDLLALLPSAEGDETRSALHIAESSSLYDSSIEQTFAEAFTALQRANNSDGWQLEREPEPLLFLRETDGAGNQGIFIPDFALVRGLRRIYIEILGFWTPAYRERKLQKLHWLKDRTDLVLAFPAEARQAFAELSKDFPVMEYTNQLSATELLRLIALHYDDFAERLANLDSSKIRASIYEAQFLAESSCYPLFHCYRRSELARAATLVLTDDMLYTPGLGIYLCSWLADFHDSFIKWIEARGESEMPLALLMQAWFSQHPEIGECDEHALEILLSLWPEVQIQRSSIFEAQVIVPALSGNSQQTITSSPASPAPKKARTARRSEGKKAVPLETGQQDLWEEFQ